jgi:hypothetical protein
VKNAGLHESLVSVDSPPARPPAGYEPRRWTDSDRHALCFRITWP